MWQKKYQRNCENILLPPTSFALSSSISCSSKLQTTIIYLAKKYYFVRKHDNIRTHGMAVNGEIGFLWFYYSQPMLSSQTLTSLTKHVVLRHWLSQKFPCWTTQTKQCLKTESHSVYNEVILNWKSILILKITHFTLNLSMFSKDS